MSDEFASWNYYGNSDVEDETPLYHPVGWWLFPWATEKIKDALNISMGAANVRLRQLCASGEVRSIRYDDTDVVDAAEGSESEEEFEWKASELPEYIKPAEWRNEEIDLTRPGIVICVSEDDVKHWIKSQGPLKEEDPKTAPSHKRDLASQAIAALWPKGVPASLLNKDIEKAVADYMKSNGLAVPSKETILRAAGRK
jgi:hypothetical protein